MSTSQSINLSNYSNQTVAQQQTQSNDISLSNPQKNHNSEQSSPSNINPTFQSKKWQKIISQQTEEDSTPFLLKPESFNSPNHAQQFNRQISMMQQAASKGRQLLTQKNYQEASKQLSKTLMAFEFIAKNYAQTIQKQVIKEMMIQTVLPAYNNLALCYLKLKNYQLVVSFTNQVLAQDDGNVKARYRRASALKELRNTDHAIKDFEIVKKLDPEMTTDCNERIKECKILEIEIKKKRKLAAQKFISGYQSDDIKTTKKVENSSSEEKNISSKAQHEGLKGFKILQWIKEKCQNCTKVFSRLRSNPSQAMKKTE